MLTLASRKSLEELRIQKSEKAAGTAFFERRPKVDGVSLEPESESHVTLRRWRLASAAIQQYPALLDQHLTYSHDHRSCYHLMPEKLLALKIQIWPWDDLLRDFGGLVVGLVLWLANFGYCAIHAAAWNDHFPSTTEKWLWRASSAYIGFCGGLWVVLNYTAKAYRPLNEFWERWDGWWWPPMAELPARHTCLYLRLLTPIRPRLHRPRGLSEHTVTACCSIRHA